MHCSKCDCYNRKVVVCGWCREGVPHSHCDDSWEEICHCECHGEKMNLNNLIGKTPEEAESELEKAGHKLRVTAKDGEPFAVTMDYSPKRVNVSVNQGKIVSVKVG